MAVRIFCEVTKSDPSYPDSHSVLQAFRYNLYGSRFQWIIVGYYEPEWWLANPGPCNTSEILQALNGTLQTRVAKLGYHGNTRTMADLVCIFTAFAVLLSNADLFLRHRINSALICQC